MRPLGYNKEFGFYTLYDGRSGSTYIPKTELSRPVTGLGMGYEEKTGIKEHS